MSQNKEATQFLHRLSKLPGGPLDPVLQPSLDDEAELRKLFATDKDNVRLSDIHVGLVDVFAAPQTIRTIRGRFVKDDDDLIAKHIMALPESRRRKEGSPAMVNDLVDFNYNWSIFTENSLQLLDWSNVVAAGGSVQACLAPLPEEAKASRKTMKKHFHDSAYTTSDVDLFLWGMTPEEVRLDKAIPSVLY